MNFKREVFMETDLTKFSALVDGDDEGGDDDKGDDDTGDANNGDSD